MPVGPSPVQLQAGRALHELFLGLKHEGWHSLLHLFSGNVRQRDVTLDAARELFLGVEVVGLYYLEKLILQTLAFDIVLILRFLY